MRFYGTSLSAESAKLVNCTIADNHKGFQGTGFVDFGGAGSSVEWDNVLADTAGQYTLTFRYATGDSRPCELFVNGQKVGRIDFAATGSWTNWTMADIKVNFKKGGNFVKVVAIGAGPNLDAMAVNK